MTAHDDRTDLEARLRASLQQRADDVEVTPALYERVQRQASRGAWLRRGLALAGAAAMVVAAVVVVPSLLPEPELDIAETPEDAQPTETSSPDVVDPLVEGERVAHAQPDAGGGSVIRLPGRDVVTDLPVVSLAASRSWTPEDGMLAAGLEDGSIVLVDQQADGGSEVDATVPAAANGGGVAFSPDGEAIAWIEGADLYVLPLRGELDGRRGLPLVGDVPDGLVVEQWFGAVDAPVILASDPAGGVWSIPMDESGVDDTAPTEPAFELSPDGVDAAVLDDLRRVELRRDGDGLVLTIDGTPSDAELPPGDDLELTTDGSRILVHGPASGRGGLTVVVEEGVTGFDVSWDGMPSGTVFVPLAEPPVTGEEPPDEPVGTDESTSDAATLGLPTDAPVIGTAGTELVVRGADGVEQRLEVYPAESEASLGRLAVRPGSTLDDGLVAVESSSEGETSVRFVALRGGAASPLGDVLVTDGPVTGLVWSEDGAQLAWSDTTALHYGTVDAVGIVDGGGEVLTTDAGPVLDWVWTDGTDGATTGLLTVAVAGGTGVEQIEVERSHEQFVTVTGPGGGSDRVLLDTHANPGAAVGPTVIAQVGGGTAALAWSADGDRSGELADPGQLGGDVRVEVSGGQVLVMGDSRQVLVTFDGDVADLPTAADWDVLD